MSRDTTGATLEQILDSDAEDKLYSIGGSLKNLQRFQKSAALLRQDRPHRARLYF